MITLYILLCTASKKYIFRQPVIQPLCSLLMKGQTPKRQAVQRLRIYSFLIRSTILSGRALSLSTKVTASNNFCAGFKTVSFSQPVHFLFVADKGQTPKRQAGMDSVRILELLLLSNISFTLSLTANFF